MNLSDIIIIGSGITGTALARELSRYDASITVIERGFDIAEGATKANSGIIHAGYDAVPGTKKAKFNVRGAAMYPFLCETLGVAYNRCGAFVIGFSDEDRSTLKRLYDRGLQNGVNDLCLITREEALDLEPSLNPEILCALDVPGSAVVSPYELAYAMADDAASNGVCFIFGENVVSIRRNNDRWEIRTEKGNSYLCSALINCSGSSGADLHNMISDTHIRMIHRRGQYYLLDRMEVLPFSRTIFQCPSAMGKGVLVSPTVHGNLLIGPNAEDITDPLDTATTSEGLAEVFDKAVRTWPSLSFRNNITNFSGVRAHLDSDDFLIGTVSGAPNAFEAVGIESPGISSAPAIAEELACTVEKCLGLNKKKAVVPYKKPVKPFCNMNDDERMDAIRKNPQYGSIICRCETVTEAEIRHAIHRPVGARTIDGVKRRTRAGMGRCQGGFCSPRVAQIISEETGIPLSQITKDGGDSKILSDTVENFLKGVSTND